MMERLGQRMTDFVGTTGAKALHAIEEVVPGIEPPHQRRVTPGRAALAVGAVAAGVASGALRRVLDQVDSSDGSSSNGSSKSNGRSSGAKASGTAKQGKSKAKKTAGKAQDLADKTRAELYELAQKADIDGRSSMSKDELVKALKSS